jgi:hypothetical protein
MSAATTPTTQAGRAAPAGSDPIESVERELIGLVTDLVGHMREQERTIAALGRKLQRAERWIAAIANGVRAPAGPAHPAGLTDTDHTNRTEDHE